MSLAYRDRAAQRLERPAPTLPAADRPTRTALRQSASGRDAATPRRLLHVFPSFDLGGAQVRCAALINALGPGFAHDLISLSGRREAAALLSPQAQVRFIAAPPPGPLHHRLARYRRQLANLRPDALLTYNWGSLEFAMANSLQGLAHVHMEDGFGPDEAVRQHARRIWTRRVLLARSEVVVPSHRLHEIATGVWRLPRQHVHHIPNAIAPRDTPSTVLEQVAPGLPRDRPRIAWAGALRPEKNPLRLLRAFAPLKDRAVLVMIGSGPEREAVLREADRLDLGSSLQLVGPRTDSRDLIMQCQILALSSDTEQMPLVVLEAMDAGLAVASVDVGDVSRMVSLANTPFITPLDETALSEALGSLLDQPDLRAEIGRANRWKVRQTYALSRMVRAYETLLTEVTDR